MERERTMQRLNLLTLAAFLLGLGAFIFDSTTPAQARLASQPGLESVAHASLDAGDWRLHGDDVLQTVLD